LPIGLQQCAEQHVYTSIIVAAELRYGAVRKASMRLAAQLEALARGLLHIGQNQGRQFLMSPRVQFRMSLDSELRARLERAGQSIGANDLLIAAHALTLGHTMVTDNEREFSRIVDLRIENWLW
jgi:tRNA(fMet)-specific endonuclease VapC